MLSQSVRSPHFHKLLRLAVVLLVAFYLLLVGGTFDATLRFRVQLLNAVAGSGLALLWLGARWRQGRRLAGTGVEWALLAFVASQWLATMTSQQPRLSLEGTACLTGWALAFLLISDVLQAGWPRQYFVNALLLVALIVTGEALGEVVNWFVSWGEIGQWPPVSFRLSGFLGHANLTAGVLNLLLPLVVVRGLQAGGWQRLGWGVLTAGMLAALFFSSSRSGWIACAAELGVLIGLAGVSQRGRVAQWRARWQSLAPGWRTGLIALGLAGVVVGGWLLARQSQHLTHPSLFTSRQFFWWPAWRVFSAYPLTGGGPDLYPWFWPAYVSVPPNEVVLHAHGLLFQLLSGSGLLGTGAALGLVIAGGLRLGQNWRRTEQRLGLAALISSLAGLGVHHVFDYLFGTPFFIFLVILIAALALTETPPAQPRTYRPLWLLPPLILVIGVMAYALRAAAVNETALALAGQGRWSEAGEYFGRAAAMDPAFPLYSEEAGQAFSRAGDEEMALHYWTQTAAAQPHWALAQASLAVLRQDGAALAEAAARAPQSYLLALNTGVVWEEAGEAERAIAAYRAALDRRADATALFWQQSAVRQTALRQWQAEQPADDSPLSQAWRALAAGEAEQARALFEQARQADPLNNLTYVGLAWAEWDCGGEEAAWRYFEIGRRLPTSLISQKLGYSLFEGDWAEAHGDRARAQAAYGAAFSAYADYASDGLGTYGYPWRAWVTFHRAALPSDLIPQLARADITAELDARFLKLGEWYAADGRPSVACYVWERVYREAPVSQSGQRWIAACGQ